MKLYTSMVLPFVHILFFSLCIVPSAIVEIYSFLITILTLLCTDIVPICRNFIKFENTSLHARVWLHEPNKPINTYCFNSYESLSVPFNIIYITYRNSLKEITECA